MIRVIRSVCILLLTFANLGDVVAQTPEQTEVTRFMHKMYSYSANMFEGRIFNGKDNPQKQCVLLREFFSPNIFTPEDSRWHGCDIVGMSFLRYPGLGSEDFDIYGSAGAIKKPNLGTPRTEGGKANISVTSEFGKVLFFLTKTDKGWRIENALYDEWPPIEDGKCRSKFLLSPNSWQRQQAPIVCQ